MELEHLYENIPGTPDTVLIIDDDEINRAILDNLFSDTYAIEEAENGRIGLERLLEHKDRICAVLLDVIMPEMDGIEVLRELKARNLLGQIPVFLITAEASDSVMRDAYEMGVMDVISKPVIPYIVSRRVNSVVELFQARKRLGNVVDQQQSELLRQAQLIIDLNVGMIESLSTAIEFRSGESGAHVRRIYDITKYMLLHTSMGEGISSEEIEWIAMAAIMHDVGKIAIPDAILNKPGRLTAEEYEIMKTHTVQGATLLEKIPQMRDHAAYEYAYDIARHHHERWDGRGYPDGLKGDEISVWAQIVSLADVYDALVSNRVYKGAFDRKEALRMIRDGECGQFNPRLLKCFEEVEPEIWNLYYQRREE
ncbi:two-component system response regulator [Lachnoclostridium sp. An14]|uniref:HD domain-containing phosphohydrolase n=1 Tax=Lachnoclostridium sp. An14 TaxID=1965562 RepID=UPI000B36F7F6|nr:HD domain-containing phosphohydrolase [Lachnoclostridium sp. An14]OUQ15408.1 two-component system response regulator [Lachnoclostridium sp. An14]